MDDNICAENIILDERGYPHLAEYVLTQPVPPIHRFTHLSVCLSVCLFAGPQLRSGPRAVLYLGQQAAHVQPGQRNQAVPGAGSVHEGPRMLFIHI
jgi:hypothetical protein